MNSSVREQSAGGAGERKRKRERESAQTSARKKQKTAWKKSGEELLHRNTEPKSSQLFDLWHKH